MALKFRRGTTAQKSGSLAFGEPYVNTTLGTLQIGGPDGDITLGSTGTGSTGTFGAISGSGLDITGNANIAGNLTLGGQLTIGDNTSDTVNVVASLSSSLIPSITNTFDLGSANYYWRDLYISTGSIKFVGTAGNVVGTLTNTGNGLNLDGGIVTNGNSSFGTSSLSSTSVTGSFGVSGYTTLSSDVRILQSLSVENDITASNLHIVNGLKIGGSTIDTVIKNRLNAESVISGSSQLTSSYDLRYVTLTTDQTITGTKTFNDIIVNGTGSFAYIESINGSAKIIGDSFIVVNTATPTSRYAGISVYDSGSTLSTASFYYDGQTNDWGYEYSSSTGVDYAVTIFGPEYSTKGSPTYLTTNRIPKANDNHHLNDSNIFDDGTTISLGTNTVVTGSMTATSLDIRSDTFPELGFHNLAGDSLYGNIYGGPSYLGPNRLEMQAANGLAYRTREFLVSDGDYNTKLIISGSTFDIKVNTVVTGSVTATSFVGSISATNGVVSGSSQVTLSSTTGGGTTSNVQFGSLGIGMAASGVSGEIKATGDIIAFASSDNRLKENIKPIENALDKVSKISGNTYDWKTGFEEIHSHTGEDVGVIAQEIEAVLPQLVTTREHGYKAVQYEKLTALLIEAIKEQQTQIHSLTLEIEKLKEQKGL